VPVLYDPGDHGKLVVDNEDDAQAAMAATRGDTYKSPAPPALDPELQKLMDAEEAARKQQQAP
jgi:hypothetical protein